MRHSARHATISEELRLYIVVAVCARLQMIAVMSTDATEGVDVTKHPGGR
jgi:hypothetical protein